MWVTETGSSTYADPSGESQLAAFRATHAALAGLGVERMYWYGLTNLEDHRPTINHVISGESRESNPHSHFLGLAPPLRAHLRAESAALFDR